MEQMKNFTTYEYKEITVCSDKAPLYLDCYESFGWKQDENFSPQESGDKVTLKLKRDRRLVNKVELTRLQRNFEATMNEILALEHSKSTAATIWALCTGLVGTAFMAGRCLLFLQILPGSCSASCWRFRLLRAGSHPILFTASSGTKGPGR